MVGGAERDGLDQQEPQQRLVLARENPHNRESGSPRITGLWDTRNCGLMSEGMFVTDVAQTLLEGSCGLRQMTESVRK